MQHRISRSSIARVAGEIVALAVAGYLIYDFGVQRGREMTAAGPAPASTASTPGAAPPTGAPQKAGDVDPATGKRVLYWHDPMAPSQHFDRPGQSPFMNMKLVPVFEDDAGADGGVSVSPRVQQSLGIRTVEVTRRAMKVRVEAVGNVGFDERDQVIVQSRAPAYIEALHVRATLDRVTKGEPLVDLYVPEWVAAQEELLSVRRFGGTDLASLVDAARQRLRQAGMTDEQIRNVDERGAVQARITLVSPIDGVVVELGVRDGMAIAAGETLFRINGLSTVWVNAAVPESQAAQLRPGAAATARSPALPGAEFRGTVQAILPEVDMTTRTIRARIELANRDRSLAPGMFVNVALGTDAAETLVVPSEAVIRTGTRSVVIVADSSGAFRPVDVEIGAEGDGTTEVRRGLEAGQMIVASGQFLVDSEASLRAASTRMQAMPNGDTPAREHSGEGRVTVLGTDTVTLSHGPIPSAGWPAMTMEFVLPASPRPELRVDQQVRFSFTLGADGKPRLTKIEPMEPGR